jgi:hypothetical protein
MDRRVTHPSKEQVRAYLRAFMAVVRAFPLGLLERTDISMSP